MFTVRIITAIQLVVCISAGGDYDDILQLGHRPQPLHDSPQESLPIHKPVYDRTQYDMWRSASNPRASTDMQELALYPERVPRTASNCEIQPDPSLYLSQHSTLTIPLSPTTIDDEPVVNVPPFPYPSLSSPITNQLGFSSLPIDTEH